MTEQLLQIAYSLSEISSTREVDSLRKLKRHMPDIERYIILTHEEEYMLEYDDLTIEVKPVWKWLLEIRF